MKKNLILFAILFAATVFCGAVSIIMSMYLNESAKTVLPVVTETTVNRFGAVLSCVFILGCSAGGFFIGITGDRIGRKKSTILSVIFLGLFTFLISYAHTAAAVYLYRFLSGTGVGGILVISFTYLNEVWNKKTVAIYAGFLSIAFPIGIFSAGTIKYFVSNWQQAFVVGIIPVVIGVIAFFTMEESAPWLNNKTAKKELLSKNLFAHDYRKKIITGAALFGTMLIGLWAIFLWLPPWVQSISTAADAGKNAGMSMMLLGAGGLLGGFCSGWFMNYAGAKRSMLTCFLVCSVCSFLLFFTNKDENVLLFIEIGLLAFSFGASQGVLSTYIPQLFPVHIKAAATGFCFNAGRVLTAVAVLFVGLLVDTFGGYANVLLAFSVVFIAGLVIVLITKPDKQY